MSKEEVIARLYREIKGLEDERDAVIFTYNQADAECARLRSLLDRAANELDFWQQSEGFLVEKGLIAEMRKAAE